MNEGLRTVALVLAAGRSSRMGIFKPLAPLGESTFVEEVVGRFFRAGIEDVRVVVGHGAEALAPVLDRLGVRQIFNADHERGMFSSVAAGVRSLEADVDWCFILPVDIPLVRPETIRALLDARDPEDPKIVYPRFDGRRGHPPLIPVAFFRQGFPADHPGGLRALLAGWDHRAVDVDVVDEKIHLDCDTPSNYSALVELRSREGIPTEAECDALLSRLEISEKVAAHSDVVAGLARLLAVYLNMAGLALDIPLVVAAGRLHDIARDRPDHAAAGAKMLAGMGYPRVGAVVAEHMDLRLRGPAVDEACLLYLADKYVIEDRPATLEERFAKPLAACADRPEVLARISRRFEDAKNIAQSIKAWLRRPVDDVVREYEKSLRAAFMNSGRVICLVRHGAVQAAEEPRRFIGQSDLPLDEKGAEQAGNLAEVLKDLPVAAVFSSDLRRSVATARRIAERRGISCIPVRELREISLGRWEGRTFDEIRREQPEEFAARGADIVRYRPPEGESFLDCAARVVPAFREILDSTPGNLVIVGHAGVNRIILSLALGRPLRDIFEIGQEYGCLNVMVQRYPGFEVRLLNGSATGIRLKDFLGEAHGKGRDPE